MKAVVILSLSQQTIVVCGSNRIIVEEKPYPVKLAKVTGKWVDGKYQTTVEVLGGGMSNNPLLNNWCKRKNDEEKVATKELQISFMLLTDALIKKMEKANTKG